MVKKPRLLDLFCGAGGASMGYYRAGFEVVGVDTDPKVLAHYPFPCVQADAMAVVNGQPVHDGGLWPPVRDVELTDDGRLDLAAFDVIHASPPCQEYSITRNDHTKSYPRLVEPLLEWFAMWPGYWVLENVPGAPMPGATLLCGSEWPLRAWDDDGTGRELRLRRHRLFASNVPLRRRDRCWCAYDRRQARIGGVYGGGSQDRARDNPRPNRGGYTPSHNVRCVLMGIAWMGGEELAEAIPPAYTEHIGNQLMHYLEGAATTRCHECTRRKAQPGFVLCPTCLDTLPEFTPTPAPGGPYDLAVGAH